MIDRLLLPFTGPALFTRECELTLAAEAAGRPMAVVKSPATAQLDHGPQDHGVVVGGQVLVVADGAAVLDDPGERRLRDPAAGQGLKACGSRLATILTFIAGWRPR